MKANALTIQTKTATYAISYDALRKATPRTMPDGSTRYVVIVGGEEIFFSADEMIDHLGRDVELPTSPNKKQ